jgi:hypothetical protein
MEGPGGCWLGMTEASFFFQSKHHNEVQNKLHLSLSAPG